MNVFIDYSLPGGTKITGKLLHIKMKYMLYFIISKHLKKLGYESYWHLKIVGCAKKSPNLPFSSRTKDAQPPYSVRKRRETVVAQLEFLNLNGTSADWE